MNKVLWLNWDLELLKVHMYVDPFEPKGSNGRWFSRRCSRPDNRPCTFVINPSLFLTLEIFVLLMLPCFSFFLWKTTRLSIYLFIYLSIFLSIYLSIYLSIFLSIESISITWEASFWCSAYFLVSSSFPPSSLTSASR